MASKKETFSIIVQNTNDELAGSLFDIVPSVEKAVFTDSKGENFFNISVPATRLRNEILTQVKDLTSMKLNDKAFVNVKSVELHVSVSHKSGAVPQVSFRAYSQLEEVCNPFENGSYSSRTSGNIRKVFKVETPIETHLRKNQVVDMDLTPKRLFGHNVLSTSQNLEPIAWEFGTVCLNTDTTIVVGTEKKNFVIPAIDVEKVVDARRMSHDSAFGETSSTEKVSSGDSNNNSPTRLAGISHQAGVGRRRNDLAQIILPVPIPPPVSGEFEVLLTSGVCERALHVLYGSSKAGCVHGNHASTYLQVQVRAAGLSDYISKSRSKILALNEALENIGVKREWFPLVQSNDWERFLSTHADTHNLEIPKFALDLIQSGLMSVRLRTRCFACRSFLNERDSKDCTPIMPSDLNGVSSQLAAHEVVRKLNELMTARNDATTYLQVGIKAEVEVSRRK
jgi:hypothetical protein